MKHMKIIFSTCALLAPALIFSACSSSNGEFDEGPSVSIVSPSDDQSFAAGSRITLEFVTRNFELGPPSDAGGHGDSHGEESHGEESHGEGSQGEEAHGEEAHGEEAHNEDSHGGDSTEGESAHSMEGMHQARSEELAAGSRDGHYHIYLNEATDEDEHVTAWDLTYEYPLPSDLEPGTHSLRVELRNNEHQALEREDGSRFEDVVFFNVE